MCRFLAPEWLISDLLHPQNREKTQNAWFCGLLGSKKEKDALFLVVFLTINLSREVAQEAYLLLLLLLNTFL